MKNRGIHPGFSCLSRLFGCGEKSVLFFVVHPLREAFALFAADHLVNADAGQPSVNDREDDVDKSGVKDVTPTSNNGGQGEDNDPFGDIIDQMYPQTK